MYVRLISLYICEAINLSRICYSGAEKFVYWLPSETAITRVVLNKKICSGVKQGQATTMWGSNVSWPGVMSILKMSEISVIGKYQRSCCLCLLDSGDRCFYLTSCHILFWRLEECELCLWETQAGLGWYVIVGCNEFFGQALSSALSYIMLPPDLTRAGTP